MQIVGYETATGEGEGDDGNQPVQREQTPPAALVIAAEDGVRREPLAPGTDLAYTLGPRHCAGRLTPDGHESCDRETAPYCDRHRSRFPCARCTGNCDLPIDVCHEEHAVYLAAFAPDAFKVGVTRSWRLDTRLREQGADRAAHLRTVADGRIAREIEAEIAVDVGDSVRVPTKVRGLDEAVDDDAWGALLADFEVIETYALDYGFALAERPVAETLATGTVRGTKGRILVLDRDGTSYAVDVRDLVGHEIEPGRDARDRQSSLGAFD